MRSTLAVAAVILCAAPALASETPVTEEATTTSKSSVEEDQDQVLCKRHRQIGSRVITQRVCMTRAEWWRLEVAVRENLYDFMMRASLGSR